MVVAHTEQMGFPLRQAGGGADKETLSLREGRGSRQSLVAKAHAAT